MDQVRDFVSQPVAAAFCAGGLAGAVSRTVVSPLERLKILFQVQSAGRNEYKLGVGRALAKMWREEGWRGFMRGNGTNCIRIVPYSAVQFGSYNFYKRVSFMLPCPPWFQVDHPACLPDLLCAGIRFVTEPRGLHLF
jgi:solute carrier family 25 phosphate transporter 23/24/25/41